MAESQSSAGSQRGQQSPPGSPNQNINKPPAVSTADQVEAPAVAPAPAPALTSSQQPRRVALHASIPVSYAYGAPSIGKPRSPAARSDRRRSSTSSSNNPRQLDMGPAREPTPRYGFDDEDDEDELERMSHATRSQAGDDQQQQAYTGRANEPAAVRYARMKQRKRDTGSPLLLQATGQANPRAGTSAPASTSGSAARRNNNHAGNGSLSSNLSMQGTSVNVATAFAEAVAGTRPVGGGNYNQLPDPRQAAEVQPEQELEGEDEGHSGSGKETHVSKTSPTGPGAKKRKKGSSSKDPSYKPDAAEDYAASSEEVSDMNAPAKRKKKATSVEPANAASQAGTPRSATRKARRKTADPSYKPDADTTGTSSDDSDSEKGHRRRRSKGKAREDSVPTAIPVGQRDGEVWRNGGKRRRARRSQAAATPAQSQSESYGDNDGLGDAFDMSEPPAQTSFFLAPKPASERARSPFDILRQQSVDPAFGEFDKSIGASFNASGPPSFDDSGLRSSSYDYSEEERIVAALEEQKRKTGGTFGQRSPIASAARDSANRRLKLPGPPGGLEGIQEEHSSPTRDDFAQAASAVKVALSRGMRSLFGWVHDPLLDWSKLLKSALIVLVASALLAWTLQSRSAASRHKLAPSPPTFSSPALAPETLGELAERLASLEHVMAQLSTASEREQSRAATDRKQVEKLGHEVLQLERGLARERHASSKALEISEDVQGKARAKLESTVRSLRTDLDALAMRIKEIGDDSRLQATDVQKLHAGLDALGKQVSSVDTRVVSLAKEVHDGVDSDRIAKIALDAIEARLPSKLVVQLDSAGKLRIDPTFWKHLRDAFADRAHVDKVVRTEVAKVVSSEDTVSPPPPAAVREPCWDGFLAANDVALRSWFASELDGRTGSDAIVTRRMFMDSLRREIKALKADFEAKANENVEQIGREILDKVAKQDEMRKKDRLASTLNPFHHRASGSGSSRVTIDMQDGKNVSAIINTLVDSALLRYSKDVLARPDYALFSAGARVIRSLTSPTYEPQPAGLSRRTLAWVTGTRAPRGLPPVVALQPGTTPGACWPFAGQQGQLGIQLSRRIVPSDVTLEHVSVDVALDGSVDSAPREFELWGVVDSPEDAQRLAKFRHDELEAKRAARRQRASAAESGSAIDDEDDMFAAVPTSVPPTPNHILLAVGVYDVSNSSPLQTFPVASAARQLAIPVNVVVLRVLSNHGEKAYTCLYRVRVGGVTESKFKEMAESTGEAQS